MEEKFVPSKQTSELKTPESPLDTAILLEDPFDGDEEEPMLKYERLAGAVPDILTRDSASCFAAGNRFLALGTVNGRVHILYPSGEEIKLLSSHTDKVTEISLNAASTHVASASMDGTVAIVDLWENAKENFAFGSPVTSLTIHPMYPSKDGKYFATGVIGQNLFVNTTNYFGHRKKKIAGGEPPIFSCVWSMNSSLLAFGSKTGVKVYDQENDKPVAFIPKPKGIRDTADYRCCLCWRSPSEVIIGWGDYVQIVEMHVGARAKGTGFMANLATAPLIADTVRLLRSVARFRLKGFHIAGVAPLSDTLLILAIPIRVAEPNPSVDEDEAKTTDSPDSYEFDDDCHPELLVVSLEGEVISSDALPILGFEKYTPKDYSLVYYGPGSSNFVPVGNKLVETDCVYYIVSPKDVVVAKVRDADDHISFLLHRGQYKSALAEARKFQHDLRVHTVRNIEEAYLNHLVMEGKFNEAAALCPKLFGNDINLWQIWIAAFSEKGQMKALAPYIPTSQPKLSDFAYGIVLRDFLVSDHAAFLNIIRDWPRDIYDLEVVVAAIKDRLNHTKSEHLLEALAELYLYSKMYSEALDSLIALKRESVFELIQKYNLQDSISTRVLKLMHLSSSRTVQLLVNNYQIIPPAVVVEQLKDSPRFQHEYLHALFKVDNRAGSQYHQRQVKFYADYQPEYLLQFLRLSTFVVLEDALSICKQRNLYDEMVFLLGRMGNTREALALLVHQIKDVKKAIDFVEEHKDESLWKELVDKSLKNPDFVGGLLDHIGEGTKFINPRELIDKIPDTMNIPNLKQKLLKILSGYNLELQLHGCTLLILNRDCVNLLFQANADIKQGHMVDPKESCAVCKNYLENTFAPSLKTQRVERASMDIMNREGRMMKLRNVNNDFERRDSIGKTSEGQFLIFYCGHKFHSSCIQVAEGASPRCVICFSETTLKVTNSKKAAFRRIDSIKQSK